MENCRNKWQENTSSERSLLFMTSTAAVYNIAIYHFLNQNQ